MTQIIPLKCFEWNRQTNTLTLASEYFGGVLPKKVTVESHHTGKRVTFFPVQPGDPKFCEDGWDGEQVIYRSSEDIKTQYLIIYHQY